ncbi:MAG TPA: HAMP domain-containing sensor histidine kinase [Micromonosporaceae bacterium]|nr:HAMP domain-containing sensor histidine kinase [Micromonosporaceae bacterium]
MLIGTAGLGVGLAVGGLLLVTVLHVVLQRALDDGARQTAADVAGLVTQDHLTDPIPTTGTQIVQVLDGEGRIRAASVGADRLVPLLDPQRLAAARAGDVVAVEGEPAGRDGPLRVVAASAGRPGEPRTVVVAAPARDLEAAVGTLRVALAVTYPLLLAALALLAWRVVGWTLRPVEALRLGAEEITGAEEVTRAEEVTGAEGVTGAAGVGRLPVPDGRDEVHRLAVTLNGMLDRLEAARARQRAVVGDAAHELRSPLASLCTQLEVAERLGERVPPADLLPEVDRLGRLVDGLLLLARADEGDPRLARRQPVELAALLAAVAADHAGARVPVTVAAGSPQWTVGDPDGLRRVVDNLVRNAVRHARSRVGLAVAPDGGGVTVTVVDDGPGIAPADRDRVFDRFTRLDDARARDGSAEGAGLGLAIVRELVRRHGGSVTLDDAGPGLRATVRLPAGGQLSAAGP